MFNAFHIFKPFGWLLAVAISASVHAQPALTLERAIVLAQDRSRQLVAQDHAVTSAREMAVAVAQLPLYTAEGRDPARYGQYVDAQRRIADDQGRVWRRTRIRASLCQLRPV